MKEALKFLSSKKVLASQEDLGLWKNNNKIYIYDYNQVKAALEVSNIEEARKAILGSIEFSWNNSLKAYEIIKIKHNKQAIKTLLLAIDYLNKPFVPNRTNIVKENEILYKKLYNMKTIVESEALSDYNIESPEDHNNQKYNLKKSLGSSIFSNNHRKLKEDFPEIEDLLIKF